MARPAAGESECDANSANRRVEEPANSIFKQDNFPCQVTALTPKTRIMDSESK